MPKKEINKFYILGSANAEFDYRLFQKTNIVEVIVSKGKIC